MDATSSAQPLSTGRSFGPLLAAAIRHARRRRVLLVVAVVVVAGGGAAGAILGSSSSYVATRPIRSALVKSPLVGSASPQPGVMVRLGVPTIVHFVPGGIFAIAVIVRNEAGAPITLERASALLPRRSPLRQIGTGLFAFEPVACPGSCPWIDPIGRPPFGAERPVALIMAPGRQALARLDFQFRDCSLATGASAPTTKRVTVSYRIPGGRIIRQRLALGDSAPQLTWIPRANACR